MDGLDERSSPFAKEDPLWILNKKKVTKWELDELFAGDEL